MVSAQGNDAAVIDVRLVVNPDFFCLQEVIYDSYSWFVDKFGKDYCYFGFDEGSMGFMDAVAAGAKTIVTPQGYHLECGFDIDFPVRTIDDIIEAFQSIQEDVISNIQYCKDNNISSFCEKLISFWRANMVHTAGLIAEE